MVPMVKAAAAEDWLPLLSPERIPPATPRTPPTAPLTAAPPMAPAAAVVASAAFVTPRTATVKGFIVTPASPTKPAVHHVVIPE
jgi:hypothetical protein